MDLILAEQLLLIALDDVKGRDTTTTQAGGSDPGLAAALLLDLARLGLLVDADDGKIVAADGAAPGHPLLAEAHAAIRDSSRRRRAKGWVEHLPREIKHLRDRVAEGLVERGILTEEHSKLLGLVPRTRYPTADPAPERDLRDRLNAVLVTGREPTEEEALLIGLLEPLDLIRAVVPREDRREARKRAKAVADHGLAGTAVHDAVREVQAAVMAAAVAGVVASGSN